MFVTKDGSNRCCLNSHIFVNCGRRERSACDAAVYNMYTAASQVYILDIFVITDVAKIFF